ncbi:MAG: transposase [Clostridiales bacterium]|nr:transposase [Clostridiales bacterium]
MLRKQYCEGFGRPAKEPEMMFKLLFLKKLYDLSDEALISSAQTDMAYKFFLDLEPLLWILLIQMHLCGRNLPHRSCLLCV